ncbi:MAG: molecular chaperone HtpG [Verrucomicrobiota bacterium]|nr:molecular chaperone HtpG [Verrucomicrobiota bacterium]
MKQNTLSIHSENILPIIKKWLYSDKDIFIRELVSNACDALNKVKILRDQSQVSAQDSDFKVSIQIDKEKKTLVIADTGIGMTDAEVEKYIAQIAFSGAEEFVQKYKSQTDKDPIIGHFGLGFYSAYMVAKQVDIDTLSFTPGATPVFWSCDGTSTYSMDIGQRKERGTEITLHLDDESLEYLEEYKLLELLNRFCRFMPFPIEVNGKPLGNQSPLWLKSAADCTEREYLEFYRFLFPMDPDPIFWIHLNVDYPFHLQGILYFPKIHRRFDTNESTIKLFCNRVFVSDNCRDVLPDYLMVLRGAIDSPDIPLNVSRSYLQVDKNVRQLSAHISKKICDRLATLYKTDREKFLASWADVEMLIKLGTLQDEKFYDRVKDFLLWKNSEGNWTTAGEYLERNPGGKVLYAVEDRAGSIVQLYRDKKVEILFANAYIDTAILSFLEDKLSCKFQRVDGAIDETLLDSSREKTLLDSEGKTEASRIADFIRHSLNRPEIEVEAKSLASDQLPGLLVLKEEERRIRDYMAMTQGKPMPHLLSKKTFVVNTNSKLVQAISRLQHKQPDVASELARHLFDLSLLTQRELEPKEAEQVLARQTTVLEKLASLIA